MRWHTQTLRRPFVSATHAWLLAIIHVVTAGCERSRQAPLRIAAASDLQLALPKLVERFEAATGIAVSMTFGASGQLATQITQGAPFDVFLSADEKYVSQLAGAAIINQGSVHRYAQGSLVLAVYHPSEDKVQSLADLKRPEVKKIALANPAIAPYGKAGKQALVNAGLWDELEPKIVITESVRQALLYAQRGDVEAALVGRAIANVPEVRTIAIDNKLYEPIIQALGIATTTKHRAEAHEFVRFVLDVEGQAILKEFGFASAENQQATALNRGAPGSKK